MPNHHLLSCEVSWPRPAPRRTHTPFPCARLCLAGGRCFEEQLGSTQLSFRGAQETTTSGPSRNQHRGQASGFGEHAFERASRRSFGSAAPAPLAVQGKWQQLCKTTTTFMQRSQEGPTAWG